ncbi:MAG: PRTRC system protein C [Campylobacterota bacterium]
MSIKTLERAFRMGSVTLDDPDPSLPADKALALYVPNFPTLATATLGDPFPEGDRLIYPVEKAPVKTKG